MRPLGQNQDYTERIEYIQRLTNIDGVFQSPIDLNIKDKVDIDLPELYWENYGRIPAKMKICNNGHTVLASASWKDKDRPVLSSGPLLESYIFSQMHFHWGEVDNEGSEHTVEDQCFPLELHVVHFKATCANQQDAMEQKDGLVVAVYFFNLEDTGNDRIAPLTEIFERIEAPYTSARIIPCALDELFDPFDDNYFMYWGSVTTESCSHRVLWLICREPMTISYSQISLFRRLQGEHGPIKSSLNFVQPLNNRNLFLVNGRKPFDKTLLAPSPVCQLPPKALASTPLTETASDFWPFQTFIENADLQSPIDIPISEEKHFAPLIFTNLFKPKGEAFMTNTGHNVRVELTGRVPLLEGGPLKGTYKFYALHFHWGADDEGGSEHGIDGKKFSAECHMLFTHVKCEHVEAAKRMDNGIVAVANFYEVCDNENCDLQEITDNLHNIMYSGVSKDVGISFFSVFRGNGESGYYTYPGSLTTGEKSKCVTWIVYPLPRIISRGQLKQFRQLKDKNGSFLRQNNRALQEINDRPIYFAV